MREHSNYPVGSSCREDEIDLGELLEVLWNWRWFIVSITLLATIFAFVYFTLRPARYRVSAHILVRNPKYVEKAASAAKEDIVVQSVYNNVASSIPGCASAACVRRMLSVKAVPKQSEVILTVVGASPGIVSRVMQVWEDTFSEHFSNWWLMAVNALPEDMELMEQSEMSVKSRLNNLIAQKQSLQYGKESNIHLRFSSLVSSVDEYRGMLRRLDQTGEMVTLLEKRLGTLQPASRLPLPEYLILARLSYDTLVVPSTQLTADLPDRDDDNNIVPMRFCLSDNRSDGPIVYLGKSMTVSDGVHALGELEQIIEIEKKAILSKLEVAESRIYELSQEDADYQERLLEIDVSIQSSKEALLNLQLQKGEKERLLSAHANSILGKPTGEIRPVSLPNQRFVSTLLAAIVGFIFSLVIASVLERRRRDEQLRTRHKTGADSRSH